MRAKYKFPAFIEFDKRNNFSTSSTKRYTARFRMSILLLFLIIFSNSSCKKFVEIPPPHTQLVSASVFTSNSTAIAAQSNVYANIANGMSYNFSLYLGYSADEWTNYSTDQSDIQLYTNGLLANNNGDINVYGIWQPSYKCIYYANAVIAGLENSTNITSAVKQQLKGEAEFSRAYFYYYLVSLFGDVPLLTTPNYQTNEIAPRSTQAQVYQQIVADLKDAQTLLNSNFLGSDCTTATTERLRPTKWAATALLARVYLSMHDWANAEIQATTVINNNAPFKLSLLTDLNSVFLKNSNEAIWQVSFPNLNTLDELYYLLTFPAPYQVTLSPQLLNSFETGDNRKTNWILSGSNAGSPVSYPYKYKVSSSTAPVSEYAMMLRLSEQYLIRAEAEANGAGAGISGAISDLNVIRHRAGLANYSGVTDMPSLLSAILHESQVEYFSEWGHRWLDLKRTGKVDAVMTVVTPQKGGTWNTNQQLYPIPLSDIQSDPKLTQNPGY